MLVVESALASTGEGAGAGIYIVFLIVGLYSIPYSLCLACYVSIQKYPEQQTVVSFKALALATFIQTVMAIALFSFRSWVSAPYGWYLYGMLLISSVVLSILLIVKLIKRKETVAVLAVMPIAVIILFVFMAAYL